jgi:hypothetical protein
MPGPPGPGIGSLCAEASGFLVGPAVFKTVEGATSSLAGSIPVRLRVERTERQRGVREASTDPPRQLTMPPAAHAARVNVTWVTPLGEDAAST